MSRCLRLCVGLVLLMVARANAQPYLELAVPTNLPECARRGPDGDCIYTRSQVLGQMRGSGTVYIPRGVSIALDGKPDADINFYVAEGGLLRINATGNLLTRGWVVNYGTIVVDLTGGTWVKRDQCLFNFARVELDGTLRLDSGPEGQGEGPDGDGTPSLQPVSLLNTGTVELTGRLLIENESTLYFENNSVVALGGIFPRQGGLIRDLRGEILACGLQLQICCREALPLNPAICYAYPINQVCPAGTTLPVELVQFRAAWVNGQAEVTWVTVAERNNAFFEVQRSADAQSWQVVGVVQGGGTTTTPQYYDFTDATPGPARRFYRLRQVDVDGAFEFSPVVELSGGPAPAERYVLYPNPTPGRVQLVLTNGEVNLQSPHHLRLLSTTGGQHLDVIAPLGEARQRLEAVMQQLPRGLYLLQISAEGHQQSIRVVKQ